MFIISYTICRIKYLNKTTLVFSTKNMIVAQHRAHLFTVFSRGMLQHRAVMHLTTAVIFFLLHARMCTREAYIPGNENVGHGLVDVDLHCWKTELQNRVLRAPCTSSRVESPTALQISCTCTCPPRCAHWLELPSHLNYPTSTAARI